MRRYAKTAFVSMLMMGLLAVPNLSPATDGSSNRDGNGRHRLLNAELRSKIEHLGNKIVEHREHKNNQGGIPGTLEALQARVTSLETALAGMVTQASLMSQHNVINGHLSVLDKQVAGGGSTDPALVELAKLANYVKVDLAAINGVKGPHVIFHDANVHVQSGLKGTTDEVDPATGLIRAGGLTGMGNLFVGFNEEMALGSRVGAGSHNLIVGPFHTYTSTGGVVFGKDNRVTAESASVLGGHANMAEYPRSSILGGNRLTGPENDQCLPDCF